MKKDRGNSSDAEVDFDDLVRALLKVPAPKKKSTKKKTAKKKTTKKRT